MYPPSSNQTPPPYAGAHRPPGYGPPTPAKAGYGRVGVVLAAVCLLAFASCAVCVAVGVANHDPEKAALRRAEAEEQRRAQTDAFMERLAALHDNFPRPERRETTTCPDDRLRELVGDGRLDLRYADREHLAHVVGRGPALGEDWKFLSAPRLISYDRSSPTREIDYLSERGIFVVYAADAKALPEDSDEEVLAGYYQGWLAVMELETAEVLCQAPLVAQNSKTVVQWNGGPMSESRGEAMLTNFRDNFRDAVDEALESISPFLRPSLF